MEGEFEKRVKKMNDKGEKLTKYKAKIAQLTSDCKNQGHITEDKHKIVLKFAQDVYKIVQTRDDKAYQRGLMQLNQNYVMSEAAYSETGKKKDGEQIEQLDRKLRQQERYIATLKINAIKKEERDKNEIIKKTKENTVLVVELNNTKLEHKKLERDNQDLLQ